MKTYKIEKDCFGNITGYACKENPSIYIEVSRGSLSHNRPTGYSVYVDGVLHGQAWGLQTLTEAKQYAEEID